MMKRKMFLMALAVSGFGALASGLVWGEEAEPAGQEEYVVGKNIFIADNGHCQNAEGNAIEDDLAFKAVAGKVVVFRGECRRGMLEGMGREYNGLGLLEREEPYRNGKREGKGKVYRDDGRPFATILYKNDRAMSGVCHRSDGDDAQFSNAEIADWNDGGEIRSY